MPSAPTWRARCAACSMRGRSPPEIAYGVGELVHNYFRTRGVTLTSYELRRLVGRTGRSAATGPAGRAPKPVVAEPQAPTLPPPPVRRHSSTAGCKSRSRRTRSRSRTAAASPLPLADRGVRGEPKSRGRARSGGRRRRSSPTRRSRRRRRRSSSRDAADAASFNRLLIARRSIAATSTGRRTGRSPPGGRGDRAAIDEATQRQRCRTLPRRRRASACRRWRSARWLRPWADRPAVGGPLDPGDLCQWAGVGVQSSATARASAAPETFRDAGAPARSGRPPGGPAGERHRRIPVARRRQRPR